MQYQSVRYTLSEAAYRGLYKLLVTDVRETFPLAKSSKAAKYTQDVRKHAPVFDGRGIVHPDEHGGSISDPTGNSDSGHKEGISHCLNYLALFYQTSDRWLDTRPGHVARLHSREDEEFAEEQTRSSKLRGPRSRYDYYGNTQGTVAICTHKWFIMAYLEDLNYIAEDDTPWDQLRPEEQQLRLSLPINREQRYLSLSDQAKVVYECLARDFHMEPYSNSHTKTTYIATALEAIGIGWLSPPENYKALLSEVTNENKYRPELVFDGTHHKYGNPSHTPFTYTPADVKQKLSPKAVPISDSGSLTFTPEELAFYRKFPKANEERLEQALAYFEAHPELLEPGEPESAEQGA